MVNGPARPLRWEKMHYRQVSLWDIIMKEFDARRFLEVWTPVISVHVAHNNLVAYGAPGHTEDHIMRTGEGDQLYDKVKALWAFLDHHGFELSSDRAKLILKQMVDGVHTSEFNRNIGNLHGRICDEMKRRKLLILPSSKQELYEQTEPPFGRVVQAKFQKLGNYEIEEASRSLALGRATACAFHLMRAVECGVHGIRKCLGLPEPVKPGDKTWGAVLGTIEREIEARDNLGHKSPWLKAEDKLPFQQMHAAAALIKNWRDPTMHLESKYTESEAEHLFALTKGFMQKVASRLDENGDPPAQ